MSTCAAMSPDRNQNQEIRETTRSENNHSSHADIQETRQPCIWCTLPFSQNARVVARRHMMRRLLNSIMPIPFHPDRVHGNGNPFHPDKVLGNGKVKSSSLAERTIDIWLLPSDSRWSTLPPSPDKPSPATSSSVARPQNSPPRAILWSDVVMHNTQRFSHRNQP